MGLSIVSDKLNMDRALLCRLGTYLLAVYGGFVDVHGVVDEVSGRLM